MDLNPCAVCKVMKERCSAACVFAPYFPSTDPEKFDRVHRIFGAENVLKILNPLSPSQRENAVNALSYEAEARIQDPIHGYVGVSLVYENHLKSLKEQIRSAENEIATTMDTDEMPQYPNLPMPDNFVATLNQEMADGRGIGGASTSGDASTSAGPYGTLGSPRDTQ